MSGRVAKTTSGATTELNMRNVVNLIKQLKSDEDGSALIEYTVLLAILLVAVILIISAVGGWILNMWSNLNSNLPS
jgi:pilus assembly protein Flp/PilA